MFAVQGLTKSYNGWDAGQIGIADALRDGEAGDGDTGDEVGFEEVEGVVRSPFENGDEVLEPEEDLGWKRLVFELSERVIREEGLLEIGS